MHSQSIKNKSPWNYGMNKSKKSSEIVIIG